MRRRRLLLIVLALALALPAVTGSATARRGHQPALKGATELAGPYKSTTFKADFTGDKTFFIKVISRATKPKTWTLVDEFGGAYDEYGYQWLHKQTDISIAVENDGYDFTLKPDKPSTFRLTIEQLPPDENPLCLYPAVSRNDGPEVSGVRFAVNGHHICD
jgi:hypothetical protein